MARRKQRLPARTNGSIGRSANSLELSTGVSKNDRAVCIDVRATTLREVYEEGFTHNTCLEVYSPSSYSDYDINVAEISLEKAAWETSLQPVESNPEKQDNHLTVGLRLLKPVRDYGIGQLSLSAEDVKVEVLKQSENLADKESDVKANITSIIVSGYLNGPDEFISGFVYLLKAGYLTVKPYLQTHDPQATKGPIPVCRLQIGVTQKSFDGCKGLLDNVKYMWSRNMLKVMKWLRPDLHTSELIYGISEHQMSMGGIQERIQEGVESESQTIPKGGKCFDPSNLYEAIKPNQSEALLDCDHPQLLATLRPYQSRAAHWMALRETEPRPFQGSSSKMDGTNYPNMELTFPRIKWPFCTEVVSLDQKSTFYYNAFSACFSKSQIEAFPDVRGGILADEMGLGKTVELLACIAANPYDKDKSQAKKAAEKAAKELQEKLANRKAERIECTCGADEDESYSGIWVQCDLCDVWQHAACVGFGLEYLDRENFKNASCKNGCKSKRKRGGTQKKNANMIVSSKQKIWSVNESFVCGVCASLIGSVEVDGISGATLIVCPSSILRQWKEEIERHTQPGMLKVMVYEGFQRGGGTDSGFEGMDLTGNHKVVGAHQLATADIVLTTYETLQADLSHDVEGDGSDQRSMRFVKRYPVVPTPLTRLHWWRVCLDEAQMVENNSARATEMARRLNAEIRWCITGTPIQRGLDDLYGLLKFLGVQPFSDSFWWSKVLKDPYEENIPGAIHFTHQLLKKIMWRSSKAHISHELDLPPQEQSLTWLNFSPVEAHFYRRQHDRCARKAMEIMDETPRTRENHRLESSNNRVLTHSEAVKVIHPLLSLRQACCHPQVGSSGLRSLQKSPMTMDEVLKVLLDKAKTEGEEAQRSLLGALNGLAALAILEQNIPHAVNIYREALSLMEENAEDFDVDPLQKLHILHNLNEVLKSLNREDVASSNTDNQSKKRAADNTDDVSELHGRKIQRLERGDPMFTDHAANERNVALPEAIAPPVCNVPRTLRDGLLEQQCRDIKGKYMALYYTKLSAARQDYTSINNQVCTLLKDIEEMHGSAWWLDALAIIQSGSRQGKDIVRKIKDTLLQKDALALSRRGHENASSLALSFGDVSGLKYIVNRELDAIAHHRERLIERMLEMDKLMDNPSAKDVEQAVNCSTCDHNQKGPSCAHCETDKTFQMYENRLFLLKSSAANIGEVVSLEDAFVAQQRVLSQKRLNTIKTAAGSSGLSEDDLVGDRQRNQTIDIANIQVTRAPSETETILKLIKANMKQKMGQDLWVASTKHLEALEAMRKEYAQARMLAVSQRMVLLALDELNMAITRLRFRIPGEEASSATEELFKVHPEELPGRNAQLTGDKFAACDALCRAKGQFRYLKGLAITRERSRKCGDPLKSGESQLSMEGNGIKDSEPRPAVLGGSDETCPVCQETLGTEMMVLPCGHMLCCKCTMRIVENAPDSVLRPEMKKIRCPSCRNHTCAGNIAYIANESDQNLYSQTLSRLYDREEDAESSIIVKGSFGTKMEAVARRILRIQRSDPDAKILIFSTWNDVLDVVEHTLSANDINFIRGKGRRNLDSAIQKFKSEEVESPHILLLLIKQGANGLNLVEAQHVILIEPLLNPGAEAQAVNRVHRIGQKNTTFVHKFLIKDTVEESINELSQRKGLAQSGPTSGRIKNNDEVSSLTLNDLKMLFKTQTDDCVPVQTNASEAQVGTMSLRDLPPSVAAAAAAEARLRGATQC